MLKPRACERNGVEQFKKKYLTREREDNKNKNFLYGSIFFII